MTEHTLRVAGTTYAISEAFGRLKEYPSMTPLVFDLKGSGEPGQLTVDEVMRTRKVSSRMSYAEAALFVDASTTAPWVKADADLADADPQETDGSFSEMASLYWHFKERMPKGVSIAKISKVLHLKLPALYPILDTHLLKAYAPQSRALRSTYPDFGKCRLAWTTIREELLEARNSGALNEIRLRLHDFDSPDDEEKTRVHRLNDLTDLRLLDILVW